MYLAGCGLFVGVFWVGGVLLILVSFGGLCAGFLGFGVGLILVSLVVLFDLGFERVFLCSLCSWFVRFRCYLWCLTWVCIVSFVCVEFAALVYGYYWVG